MSGILGFCNHEMNYREDSGKWFFHLQEMTRQKNCQKLCKNQYYLSSHAGLSQSILPIDLPKLSGPTPYKATLQGKNAVLVLHGEIYNQEELIDFFTTNHISLEEGYDKELILKGYLYEGIEFVKRINGVFSMAIWDETQQILYLVRDRLGVKPLFYTYIENTLVFATELMVLFSFPGITPVLDSDGIMEILGLGPAKKLTSGVLRNIFELPPGTILSYQHNISNMITYWKLESFPHAEDFQTTVDHVRFLINDSVNRQLKSNGQLCSFLSGGIDSSLVTSLANRYLQEKGKSIDTFSFDFTDSTLHFKANAFQPSLDRPFVEQMQDYLGTTHHYLECNRYDLYEYLFKAVDARGLPCMGDIESSLIYFCEKVSDTHDVALTGECADEIFGGYPWFHNEEMKNASFFPWSIDFSPRTMLLNDELSHRLPIKEYTCSAYEEALKEVPYMEGESESEKKDRRIGFLTIRFFMQTLLDRCDRAGNNTGLTARVPFADYRLVQYLWNVPWEMKNHGNTVKGLLREASKGLLPDAVLYRKKSPYPKTYDPDYEKLLKNELMEVLRSSNAPLKNIIDATKVSVYFSQPSNVTRPFYGQLMAGPQLIAYLLQVNYWLEHFQISVI